MGGTKLDSASGLRPAGAFGMIALVVIVALARSVQIAFAMPGEQPDRLTAEPSPHRAYDIVDAKGRPLARSVERLDLVMSPRAMWRTHTPDLMAREIAGALGGEPSAVELLDRMLPDAVEGVVRTDPAALALDAWQATRVSAWTERGSVDPEAERRARVQGIWVEPTGRENRFRLCWMPEITLSRESRADHGFEGPSSWTRRLLDDLAVCIQGPRPAEHGRARDEWEASREAIWAALVPRRYKVVEKGVPAGAAAALMELFTRQGVNHFQMDFERGLDRRYPPREEGAEDAFSVLGRWGWTDGASKSAALEGLELVSAHLLSAPDWSFLDRAPALYAFDAWQAPRHPLRPYYRAERAASEPARVVSTIDARVQREMRRQLEETLERHDAAVVLGIAIEVETGAVIAVDGVDAYELSGFLPVRHTFTPGSTMKAIVMACALDAGVVRPAESFVTHDGHFVVPGSRRTISEARGAPTGVISASRAISESCNAVLVQVGMRLEDAWMRERLTALGYGVAPRIGVGNEAAGYLPPVPWKPAYTHASICFGHELSTTLWQHAGALATVVRGGEALPLTLVRAVEHEDDRWELERPAPVPVLSRSACEELRAMMVEGARTGTGKRIACDDLFMGTKTGTAQKVGTELCLHVELDHLRRHATDAEGRPVTSHRACRKSLVGQRLHKRSCYTSSMCAFGRRLDDDREVLVLVVVEEPRKHGKFGADVAGPATVAVLREALGMTRAGRVPLERGAWDGADGADEETSTGVPHVDPDGFVSSTSPEENPFERPWAADPDGCEWTARDGLAEGAADTEAEE